MVSSVLNFLGLHPKLEKIYRYNGMMSSVPRIEFNAFKYWIGILQTRISKEEKIIFMNIILFINIFKINKFNKLF